MKGQVNRPEKLAEITALCQCEVVLCPPAAFLPIYGGSAMIRSCLQAKRTGVREGVSLKNACFYPPMWRFTFPLTKDLFMAVSKSALRGSVAALLLAFTLGFVPQARAEDDPVIARVNGQEIHRSDVMREMSGLPPQLQQIPLENLYPQLLERMIDGKLLMAEGLAQKVNESEDYKKRVKNAEERILTDMTLRSKVKPLVTDDKVKARYDAIVAKSKPEEEVRARHILVKTEKEAQDIIAELGKGGDFAKLAESKSTDTGSAKQGGDLGFFTKGVMVPAFAKAAFEMKPGEVSKAPVKTEFGFHVIKVEDKRKAEPVKLEKVRAQLEAQVAEEAANDYVEGLKKGVKIERFALDGKPLPEKKEEKREEKKEEAPAEKK